MKKLALILVALLALASAQAANIVSNRSLNNAGSVSNGSAFGQVFNGAATSVTVMLTGTTPSLTAEVQVLQPSASGTVWIPVTDIVYSGTITAANSIYVFNGPCLDVRVVVTAYTSGTITAWVSATY